MAAPTPKATQVTTAITTALQGIQTAGDYHTNLGSRVYAGQPAQYQGDTIPRPYVCVIAISDGPNGNPRKQQSRVREYSIEVVLDAGANYHDDQDEILWDLIKAFSYRTQSTILSGTAQSIELGDASLDGPEMGSDKCMVILPVTVAYVDTFD